MIEFPFKIIDILKLFYEKKTFEKGYFHWKCLFMLHKIDKYFRNVIFTIYTCIYKKWRQSFARDLICDLLIESEGCSWEIGDVHFQEKAFDKV